MRFQKQRLYFAQPRRGVVGVSKLKVLSSSFFKGPGKAKTRFDPETLFLARLRRGSYQSLARLLIEPGEEDSVLLCHVDSKSVGSEPRLLREKERKKGRGGRQRRKCNWDYHVLTMSSKTPKDDLQPERFLASAEMCFEAEIGFSSWFRQSRTSKPSVHSPAVHRTWPQSAIRGMCMLSATLHSVDRF